MKGKRSRLTRHGGQARTKLRGIIRLDGHFTHSPASNRLRDVTSAARITRKV